jgi:hypothetical protein
MSLLLSHIGLYLRRCLVLQWSRTHRSVRSRRSSRGGGRTLRATTHPLTMGDRNGESGSGHTSGRHSMPRGCGRRSGQLGGSGSETVLNSRQ